MLPERPGPSVVVVVVARTGPGPGPADQDSDRRPRPPADRAAGRGRRDRVGPMPTYVGGTSASPCPTPAANANRQEHRVLRTPRCDRPDPSPARSGRRAGFAAGRRVEALGGSADGASRARRGRPGVATFRPTPSTGPFSTNAPEHRVDGPQLSGFREIARVAGVGTPPPGRRRRPPHRFRGRITDPGHPWMRRAGEQYAIRGRLRGFALSAPSTARLSFTRLGPTSTGSATRTRTAAPRP